MLKSNDTSSVYVNCEEGYLLSCDCTVLVEYGRHVCLTLDWACSLLKTTG